VPLFLPLVLGERCSPVRDRADVVLVADTSSSMAGQKLADAKEAALAFVAQMDLSPQGGDQVAVVRFDRESETLHVLSRDRAGIEAAIAALASREGTHIDKGLTSALAELRSPRHELANTPVIVLLTDGIHNGEPGAEQRAAEEVRAAGVRLYVIGLGADVDAEALLRMAGDARRYFFAPDSSDLAGIYADIARDIVCPNVGFWGPR
jgi:Mg-chelatase subunit ChlD